MADRYWKAHPRTLEQEIIKLFGVLTFGAVGAITAAVTPLMTVAKTAGKTGRYTVTLADGFPGFRGFWSALEGAADAALTIADGNLAFIRNVNVNVAAGGSFDIQLVRLDTGADAEPTSGSKLHFEIALKNSTVAI